jgi:hypothetical protein
MPIALFPILEQEEPMWRWCLWYVINPEGSDFHVSMAAMTKYA